MPFPAQDVSDGGSVRCLIDCGAKTPNFVALLRYAKAKLLASEAFPATRPAHPASRSPEPRLARSSGQQRLRDERSVGNRSAAPRRRRLALAGFSIAMAACPDAAIALDPGKQQVAGLLADGKPLIRGGHYSTWHLPSIPDHSRRTLHVLADRGDDWRHPVRAAPSPVPVKAIGTDQLLEA